LEKIDFPQTSGISTSTYPLKNKITRMGDPIVDGYRVSAYDNGLVFCLTDGCSWGDLPKEASERTKSSFMSFMQKKLNEMKSTKDVSGHLLSALAYSHYNIVRDKPENLQDLNSWNTGTTMVLGGVVLENENNNNKEWMIIAICVGDCKAFLYSNKEKKVIDLIEKENFDSVSMLKDISGSIGPSKNGEPNLENLKIVVQACEPDDLLILLTDGVHDNLDPEILGKSPKEFELNHDLWSNVDQEVCSTIKKNYMLKKLKEIIEMNDNPKEVSQNMINHCVNITSASREFLVENPNSILTNDYVNYPGKMDHATVVSHKIGKIAKKDRKKNIVKKARSSELVLNV